MVNCCDEYGDCRQGRDCPVRVARVGARYQTAEQLPPSEVPALVKRAAKIVLLGIVGLLLYSSLLLAFVVD